MIHQAISGVVMFCSEYIHERVAHTIVHAQRNIISRSIISHIAVMTLGRYVDYTVGKQQPADWVSILPYITSLHSSLCFFYWPHFFKSLPTSPVSWARFQATRAGDVE